MITKVTFLTFLDHIWLLRLLDSTDWDKWQVHDLILAEIQPEINGGQELTWKHRSDKLKAQKTPNTLVCIYGNFGHDMAIPEQNHCLAVLSPIFICKQWNSAKAKTRQVMLPRSRTLKTCFNDSRASAENQCWPGGCGKSVSFPAAESHDLPKLPRSSESLGQYLSYAALWWYWNTGKTWNTSQSNTIMACLTKCIDCTPEGLEVPKENLGTGLIEWLVTSTTRGSQDRSHMTSNHYIIQIIHIYMHIYNYMYHKYTQSCTIIVLYNMTLIVDKANTNCPHFHLEPFLAAVETHSVARCQHQFEDTPTNK